MCAVSSSLIKGALSVHKEVSDTFRKSVLNFHYEFNLRHLTNIFQGLLASDPTVFADPEKLVYLWVHESERVYGDRLVNNEDVTKFKHIMQSQAKKAFGQFNVSKFYLAGAGMRPENLVFCHFADGTTQAEDLTYDRGLSITDLRYTLEQAQEDYNEINTNLNLILFDDAVLHIARVVRILKSPNGHALLVGVACTGKQSVARLASWVCGYQIHQLKFTREYSISDFKTDLQGKN